MDFGRIGLGALTGGLSEMWQDQPFGIPKGSFRNSQFGEIDPQGNVAGQSGAAGRFATQGEQGYGRMTGELDADREFLRRLRAGQNSISAEQLRQGLQQNLAGMQSMAAGARPGMQPMAARTAMIQGARLGGGLAGQQALAGIAERNAAAAQLANMNIQQRGQDMQVGLGGRQNALQGFLGLEQARTGRYGADMGVPSRTEALFGGLSSVLGSGAMGG